MAQQPAPRLYALRAAQAAEEADAAAAHAEALAAQAHAAAADAVLMGSTMKDTDTHNEALDNFAAMLGALIADLPHVQSATPPASQHALSIVTVLLTAAAEATSAAALSADAIAVVSRLQDQDPSVRSAAVSGLAELDASSLAQHAPVISQQLLMSESERMATKERIDDDAALLDSSKTTGEPATAANAMLIPPQSTAQIAAADAGIPIPPLTFASLSTEEDDADAKDDKMGAQTQKDILVESTTDPDADAVDSNAGHMLSEEAKQEIDADADGDGIPDVAKALFFMVDADGDGVNDGLHSDKLGRFIPQKGLTNERPFFVNESNSTYSLWWGSGKFFIGLTADVGRNRGWLKVSSMASTPPSEGWQVYSKADKKWVAMEGLICNEEA